VFGRPDAANQFDKPFVRGLEHKNVEWPVVYLDDNRSFVDIKTPQVRLRGHIHRADRVSGPVSADMALGHNLLLLVDGAARTRSDC
jgi:hypothetical protein